MLPIKKKIKPRLNFHLSKREKKDVVHSIKSYSNAKSFEQTLELLYGSRMTWIQMINDHKGRFNYIIKTKDLFVLSCGGTACPAELREDI